MSLRERPVSNVPPRPWLMPPSQLLCELLGTQVIYQTNTEHGEWRAGHGVLWSRNKHPRRRAAGNGGQGVPPSANSHFILRLPPQTLPQEEKKAKIRGCPLTPHDVP